MLLFYKAGQPNSPSLLLNMHHELKLTRTNTLEQVSAHVR